MNECRAESVRLLYVALTRAKVAVFLAYGAVNTAENGALFRLLSPNSCELTPEAVRQSLEPLKKTQTSRSKSSPSQKATAACRLLASRPGKGYELISPCNAHPGGFLALPA